MTQTEKLKIIEKIMNLFNELEENINPDREAVFLVSIIDASEDDLEHAGQSKVDTVFIGTPRVISKVLLETMVDQEGIAYTLRKAVKEHKKFTKNPFKSLIKVIKS